MINISDRIKSLAPSATLAMSQKSNELKAQGIDVINLSVGEPDFPTPTHIKAAAIEAIADNFTFYTPVPGYLTLREAICEKLRTENGLEYTPAQIVVGNGAKQELCNVILATINPGDEVIIPTPAWVSYVEMVKLAEGKSVLVPATIESNFKITPAQLEAAITPATRMVLLCSPSNPTGSVYSREELQGLVEVLAKYPDIIVLADEIYEHINYTGSFTSLGSFPEIADRVVIINGV
ncbi:MAG: aminotransferase class I/II-fold pyridoxal phosphate-dependent enzyme, partial [Bacteroidales bacterium]|nr:aminotransferase class I/II-fold pyridoxal phosphate-dependent enzyme [Bacteroidales bacterium]